jgi:inhibitor of cysteine peptidase
MRHITGLAVGIFAVSLLLGPVHGGEDKGVTVTDKANDTKVKLAKGKLLTVQLPGNPTTGFQWFVEKNNKEQLAPQGKGEYTPARKGVIGGGGTFTFRFRAEKAGTSELELVYKRGFEKGKAPAKTFKLTVEIE